MSSLKYFESQQADESVVLLVRRHVLALFPILGIALMMYLIAFVAVFVLPGVIPAMVTGFAYNIYVLLVSLLFLFTTIFLFNNWVLYYLHVAILTTEHFVEVNQAGLFSRRISEMTLEKIQDVSASQKGFLNTLLNVGEVMVQTAGEAPNFIIEYVPNANCVARKIMETEELYRERMNQEGEEGATRPREKSEAKQPIIEYPESNGS